ncbi:glycosyltransferase family 2 protein [Rhodotorula paludigena]|uniref:glycosyltransferase family 2 protein n=1 Tax=Rhodotorula paludigena TaxID=86838 RepID=UPI003176ED35
MAPTTAKPARSLASRLFSRNKPAPAVNDEEAKYDEKVDDIDMVPELEGGLETEASYNFMASHTFRTCAGKRWVKEDAELADGVAIRLSKRNYVVYPVDERLNTFQDALNELNCEIAITISADVVKVIVGTMSEDAETFALDSTTSIQIVDTMSELAFARPAQHACFIRDEQRLVVWADKIDTLESTVQDFETKLVHYVFNRTLRRNKRFSSQSTISSSSTPRDPFQSSPSLSALAEEENGGNKEQVVEHAASAQIERTLPLNHSIYTGCSAALALVLVGLLPRALVYEVMLDGEWIKLAILAAVPFLFCIAIFFAENVLSVILKLLAPIGHMSRNSLFYSAVPPIRQINGPLPHITVMMPVYKESLEEVLAPTIESVSQCIRTYELQGGTASIIVCEDGMQLVDAAEVEKRKDYYDRWNVAWVARPKENRAGRFKKSSNLNVTHALSLRIEALMDQRRPADLEDLAAWTQVDEDRLYEAAFAQALEETDNVLWANGNIRIGELILMIDSDTRVPRDCLLDGACEMAASPEVGVLQHASGTFLAGAGYFEDFIAFFTTTVNHSISWVVANGASAPFMGHNAFLRWSALQHQATANPEGKIWSEEHVSEDFVMTLNLVRAGYITRWATYSNFEFKEGVSLSCDDELNRWQKYAFGCSEIVFNPFLKWFTRGGPFSKLFMRYLWADSPLPCKFSNSSYIASYWAIAVAPPLSVLYYFLGGEFAWTLSGAFLPAFGTLLSVIIVFSGGGTIAIISSRYRSQAATLWRATKEGFGALPYAITFFTGISFHVMTALLAHITGYNMQWSTTKKDLETPTITQELPVVFKRHWLTFLLGFITIAGVAIASTPLIPLEWRIHEFPIMFPLLWLACGHVLYPLLLNPAIMLFRF